MSSSSSSSPDPELSTCLVVRAEFLPVCPIAPPAVAGPPPTWPPCTAVHRQPLLPSSPLSAVAWNARGLFAPARTRRQKNAASRYGKFTRRCRNYHQSVRAQETHGKLADIAHLQNELRDSSIGATMFPDT
eukprot:4730839-Pyramimonas_sp.AAC.1